MGVKRFIRMAVPSAGKPTGPDVVLSNHVKDTKLLDRSDIQLTVNGQSVVVNGEDLTSEINFILTNS